jgi:hypothetical protein
MYYSYKLKNHYIQTDEGKNIAKYKIKLHMYNGSVAVKIVPQNNN